MATNTAMIQTLGEYFASKGGAMTYMEYREQLDAPIRPILLKRSLGPWNRILAMIGDLDQYQEVKKDDKKAEA